MDTNERSFRVLALIAMLAFGFLLLSYFATDLLPARLGAKATVVQGVLGSISASFVFLFVLDALHLMRESRTKRAFCHFFGDLSDSSKAAFVYPDFVLSTSARHTLETVPTDQVFSKRSSHYPGTRFIDVPQIVASNDLQAIVIMATRLGRLLGGSPNLLTDGEAISDRSKSLISFGLTSNAITDLYLQTDLEPLFQVEDSALHPRIVVTSGGMEEKFGQDDADQHGIILRYRPNPDYYPKKVWFICAGLAAAGTPAAAWTLSHRWKEYHRRFRDSDFLIVFKTTNDVFSYENSLEVRAVVR